MPTRRMWTRRDEVSRWTPLPYRLRSGRRPRRSGCRALESAHPPRVQVPPRRRHRRATRLQLRRREAGWRAAVGERPDRRMTNSFRRHQPGSLRQYGEPQTTRVRRARHAGGAPGSTTPARWPACSGSGIEPAQTCIDKRRNSRDWPEATPAHQHQLDARVLVRPDRNSTNACGPTGRSPRRRRGVAIVGGDGVVGGGMAGSGRE